MIRRKPVWDIITDQTKRECMQDIIAFFQDERGEKIGMLASEQILDIVLEKITWDCYNKGVDEAKELMQGKFADLSIDVDLLRKSN